MERVNITALRQNIYEMFEQAIKYNEIYNVTTKDGDAVIMSKEEYELMEEMMFFHARPQLKQELIDSLNAPEEDFIPAKEFNWDV